MADTSLASWVVLAIVLTAAIAADLGFFHARVKEMPLRSAAIEIASWIGLSILFGLWIGFSRGWHTGADFFSAYLIEKSLSVDNIFLFLVIFRSFGIARHAQHKVLYSGIACALVLRGAFIFGGLALLQKFHFVLYVFGALLILAGFFMLTPQAKKTEEGGWLIRFIHACLPATEGKRAPNDVFFVRSAAGWQITSLLMALIAVELADVVFALDSVPAVLAVTRDPFIACSSNIFAILGLRAMYFGIAAILPRFRYLHQGLAAILLFVGGKMVLSDYHAMSGVASLVVVAAILSIAILASWLAHTERATALHDQGSGDQALRSRVPRPPDSTR